MQPKITFRSMEHSYALESLALEKLQKLDKFLQHHAPYHVELILEAHKVHNYFIAELRVQKGNLHLTAKDEGKDMYTVIDTVVAKMVHELAKAKEKQLDADHGR